MTAKTKFENHIYNTLLIVGVFLLFITKGYTQSDTANYEVSAGPDIDVCEGGSVGLHGSIGGNVSQVVWRGGKGTFTPSRNSIDAEYTPAEEEIGTGVVLTLVASNPRFNSPAARSEIKVKVNSQPKADAGIDQRICAGETLHLAGVVTGKAKKVTWRTNGTGKFDNARKADAIYTPSKEDITGGALSLEFTAYPFGVCDSSSDAMILMFNPLPEIATDADLIYVPQKPVKLIATVTGEYDKVKWETSGTGKFENSENIQTNYLSSGDDIKKKTVMLYVSASKGSCTTKKPVTLHINNAAGSTKN